MVDLIAEGNSEGTLATFEIGTKIIPKLGLSGWAEPLANQWQAYPTV